MFTSMFTGPVITKGRKYTFFLHTAYVKNWCLQVNTSCQLPLWCHEQDQHVLHKYLLSWANILLLFISKVQTKMAATYGAQFDFWGKRVLLMHKCWQDKHTKNAYGNICTFSVSMVNFHLCLWFPSITSPLPPPPSHLYLIYFLLDRLTHA